MVVAPFGAAPKGNEEIPMRTNTLAAAILAIAACATGTNSQKEPPKSPEPALTEAETVETVERRTNDNSLFFEYVSNDGSTVHKVWFRWPETAGWRPSLDDEVGDNLKPYVAVSNDRATAQIRIDVMDTGGQHLRDAVADYVAMAENDGLKLEELSWQPMTGGQGALLQFSDERPGREDSLVKANVIAADHLAGAVVVVSGRWSLLFDDEVASEFTSIAGTIRVDPPGPNADL